MFGNSFLKRFQIHILLNFFDSMILLGIVKKGYA